MSVDPINGTMVLAFSAWASIYDVAHRRIPNLLIIATLAACMMFYVYRPFPWSWWGVGAAFLLTTAAALPAGDRKAVMVLGGLLGVAPLAIVCAVAYGLGALAFVAYRLRYSTFPGEWALFPFFAVPACAIVLALGYIGSR